MDTWAESLSDTEKATLEFQVDIFQGGMSGSLVYDLVKALNANSVGITNLMDYRVTRWHCQGVLQAQRCLDAIQKAAADASIPYRLLSKAKNTVYVQQGDFPEGSAT